MSFGKRALILGNDPALTGRELFVLCILEISPEEKRVHVEYVQRIPSGKTFLQSFWCSYEVYGQKC